MYELDIELLNNELSEYDILKLMLTDNYPLPSPYED